jgi:hypothetical protein
MKRFMNSILNPKFTDEAPAEEAVIEQEINAIEEAEDAVVEQEEAASVNEDIATADQIQGDIEQVEDIKETIATEGYTRSMAMLCEKLGLVEYATTHAHKSIVGYESLSSTGKNEEMAALMIEVCDQLIVKGNESLSDLAQKLKTKIGQLATSFKQKFQDFDVYFTKDIEAKLKGVNKFDEEKLASKKIRILSKADTVKVLATVEKNVQVLSAVIKNMAAKADKNTWISSKVDRSAATEILDKFNTSFAEIVRASKLVPQRTKQTIKDSQWKVQDVLSVGKKLIAVQNKLIDLSHTTEELVNKFVLIIPFLGPAIFNLINIAVIHAHESILATYGIAIDCNHSIRRVGMNYIWAIEKE